MAAVVFLAFACLLCTARAQVYGSGPVFPGPWNIDPGPCGSCAADIYGPCGGPYGPESYGTIPALPNLIQLSQPACATPIPCGQPILNNLAPSIIQNQVPAYPNVINQAPCSQPLFTNVQIPPSIITNPVPQCASVATPVVSTTVVDNTLANSLANAIQLLIVSNLIENTLGSSSGSSNALAQVLGLLDSPCVNNFDVASPDFYPSPQIISCEYPSIDGGYFNNDSPYFQEPVRCPSFVDVSCGPNFGPVSPPFIGQGDCNSLTFDNSGYNSILGLESVSNPFNFNSGLSSFGCLDPAVAPMAVEVPFPASIPAQLTCNFGYLPTNVPCVNVNVEPLPFDGCGNIFGNIGNGVFY